MSGKPRLCTKCKNDEQTWDDPAEATGLWRGTYWNDADNRIMPITIWICDMHVQEMESGRWIK